MEKMLAFFDLFRKGSEVANPALWRSRQVTGTMLAGVIGAAVHVLELSGVGLPVVAANVDLIAGALVTVYNVALTVATSKDHGV